MGVEWTRDLSITILGFVASGVLIFAAVLAYRLYRETTSALSQLKAASKRACDTVSLIQELVKPLIPVVALVQGVREGLTGIIDIVRKRK